MVVSFEGVDVSEARGVFVTWRRSAYNSWVPVISENTRQQPVERPEQVGRVVWEEGFHAEGGTDLARSVLNVFFGLSFDVALSRRNKSSSPSFGDIFSASSSSQDICERDRFCFSSLHICSESRNGRGFGIIAIPAHGSGRLEPMGIGVSRTWAESSSTEGAIRGRR